MKILSIETSCDETGVSILEVKGGKKNPIFRVLANNLNSQIQIHTQYGGVFPALAKREHQKNLPILLEKTLHDAKLKKVDLIVVTSGPGLEPALWTGIVFAKDLSEKWHVPVMPVNHMEGHMLSVFGNNKGTFKIPKIEFPALALLVSGGHTELVLAKGWRKYKIIGETLDDAAGEAFDKVARMMGLPYPGGPEISKLATKARSESVYLRSLGKRDGAVQRKFLAENFRADQMHALAPYSLPRPMLHSKNFDFSFSGLKTAVLYLIRRIEPLNDEKRKQIALEFENAVVETLVHKTKKAQEKFKTKTLIVAGGVSGNKHLQKEIKKTVEYKKNVLFPSQALSTDNSVMIGIAGYFKFLENNKKGVNPSKIKANGSLRL